MKELQKKVIDFAKGNRWLVILLFVSLVISLAVVWLQPEYLYRGASRENFSIFSTTFVKGCMHIGLLWLYVFVILLFLCWLCHQVIKRMVGAYVTYQQGKTTKSQWIWMGAGIIGTLAAAVLAEGIWGYFIVGAPTSTGSYFNPYRFLFFICIAMVVFVGILYLKKQIHKFEDFFLLTTLIIGFCFAFGLPMGMFSWDDGVHYNRSVRASQLGEVYFNRAELDMLDYRIAYTHNLADLEQQKLTLDQSTETEFHGVKDYKQALYSHLAYAPSGTAIALCKLFSCSYAFTFYMGRYANLIFYAVMIYLGMGRLKSGKIILALVAWFPINIFLAANYSYDFFLTSLTMLGFSYLVGELQRPGEQMTWKNACIMASALFFGIGTKAIYFPMLLLCFLLPAEKFKNKKTMVYFRGIIVIVTLITLATFLAPTLISTATGGGGGGDMRGGENVSVAGQMAYVLKHPFTYAKILFSYIFKDYINLRVAAGYTAHFAYLGFIKVHIPVMMLFALGCFLDHNQHDAQVLTPKFRIVTIGINFLTIMLVATSMYLVYTNVGSDTINGAQSRYLEPMIFPIAFSIGTAKIHYSGSKRWMCTAFTAAAMWILFSSIWQASICLYG